MTNPKNQATYIIFTFTYILYIVSYIYIVIYILILLFEYGDNKCLFKSYSECKKTCWTKNIAPVDVANVPLLAVFCLFQLLQDF